jgi:hypothetical protein
MTGGFSLIAVLLLAPLAHRSGLAQTLLVIHLLIITAVVAAVTWFHIADREAPWWINRVPMAAAALYVVTVDLVFLLRIDAYRPSIGGLPWFTAAVRWTLIAQAFLLVVVAVLTLAIAASTRWMVRPEARKADSGHEARDLADRRFRRWSGRLVTRILVDSHVKGKLKELQIAYVRIEQALPDAEAESVSDFRQWLKDTQDSSSRFSNTLTSWASIRGLGATLWPAVLGLLLAKLGVENVWVAFWRFGTRENLVIALLLLSLVTLYILLVLVLPFRKKRGLFLAPVELPDTWSCVGEVIRSRSVYDAEGELFDRLAQSKKPEFPLDWFAVASLCFGFAMVEASSILSAAYSPGRVLFGIVTIILLVLGIFALRNMWRRSLR